MQGASCLPYHVWVYRLLTWMRAGQGLSFDRNSKDVEILSEIYLQSVQVASPTVTDYGGLSGKLWTAERHRGQGKPASVLWFWCCNSPFWRAGAGLLSPRGCEPGGAPAAPTCSPELGAQTHPASSSSSSSSRSLPWCAAAFSECKQEKCQPIPVLANHTPPNK